MKTKLKAFVSALLIAALVFGLSAVMQPAADEASASANAGPAWNVGPRGNSANDPVGGIYVSPSGSDTGARGSKDKPFKSINAALAAANPGDTIILRGGTYREGVNVRVRKPNITIRSAKGEWAVIDLTRYNPGHDEDSGVYFDVDSSGGRLQSVEVMGGFYAVCMETRWDWGNAANRKGASNIIIEDCKLHSSRNDVVKVKPNCNNITIRYNEIYNSGIAYGGGPGNAEGIDNVNGANMIVQNNYIHDICSTAIYAKGGATDVLIENNRIERAKEAGILVGFDTSPEFFDTATNPKYYENIRGTVRNNLIIDTGLSGIGLYAAKDAHIHNNTLVNVANEGLYHSAIYFGVTFQDWESYAGRPASLDPKIHNNIVCQPSNFVRPMIEIRYANELGGLSALDGNPIMSNNCYYVEGKSAVFSDRRPGRTLENAGLAAWQSHIGGDGGSIEVNPSLNSNYIATNTRCAGMGLIPGESYPTTPGLFNFVKTREYKRGSFRDVDENAWYGVDRQSVIAQAYMYGLMDGSSATAFRPMGNMTIAEAVAVAARMHHIYNGGDGRFFQSNPWYRVYVDYAITNKIIESNTFPSYGKAATRAEMAFIFSRVLPADEYKPQNTVNSLPDVDRSDPCYDAILLLCRAGIVAGNANTGMFNPGNSITRAEAAAIISRVILPPTRFSGLVFG